MVNLKRNQSKKLCRYFLFLLITLLIVSCEKEWNNPFDEKSETSKTIILLGPVEGEIIGESSVTFTWEGNEWAVEYSTKLNDDNWSEWTSVMQITYDYLGEGEHTFQVKSRSSAEDKEEIPKSTTFTVNAIAGPAFVMERQLIKVNNNSLFFIDIIAEEADDLLASFVKIEFDTAKLEVLSIDTTGTGNWSANADGITFVTTSVADANTNGWMEINTTRLGGKPAGMSETGTVARITFTASNIGITIISFSTNNTCQMRDSNNGNIDINDLVETRVEIN